MKKTMTVLALALVVVACQTKPPEAPQVPAARMAIEVQYVGVPTMNVYARPSDTAEVITTYGYTETVSILAREGNWVEVRTVDGSGWAHATELIAQKDVEPILGSATPRFMTAPVAIPDARAHGDIVIKCMVNTDGQVVSTTMVKNTTGSQKLGEANAAALQQARFYPIIQKGQRVTFTYEYSVTY